MKKNTGCKKISFWQIHWQEN